MTITAGPVQTLGTDRSWLRFGEGPREAGGWRGNRLLYLDEQPAFELSFWCGTCAFLFRRLPGATQDGSFAELDARLTRGVERLEGDLVDRFATLLPRDSYLPMLLAIQPRLVTPAGSGDYFAVEQVQTWGLDPFWGLPAYPATPYYRTFETLVDPDSHLYEFVVPMVPPTWNHRSRVAELATVLAGSDAPTAVAVAILDVCQPASGGGEDPYAHWALTHFLLDGHHKLEAAAATGRPLRLLSLLAVGSSLATSAQVARIPDLRSRPAVPRAD